jgi:hypothetical protein
MSLFRLMRMCVILLKPAERLAVLTSGLSAISVWRPGCTVRLRRCSRKGERQLVTNR